MRPSRATWSTGCGGRFMHVRRCSHRRWPSWPRTAKPCSVTARTPGRSSDSHEPAIEAIASCTWSFCARMPRPIGSSWRWRCATFRIDFIRSGVPADAIGSVVDVLGGRSRALRWVAAAGAALARAGWVRQTLWLCRRRVALERRASDAHAGAGRACGGSRRAADSARTPLRSKGLPSRTPVGVGKRSNIRRDGHLDSSPPPRCAGGFSVVGAVRAPARPRPLRPGAGADRLHGAAGAV